jgi:hypothetical protein
LLSVVSICFVLACPILSFAQTAADAPASKEDVERYLEAMHSHEMMKQMMGAMSQSMHQTTHDLCAKDKDQLPADCEARANKIMDDMVKDLPLDEMMDAMVPVYQKHFTKGDIEALVAFYSGPTGQKMLRELPATMAEAMEAMRPFMSKAVDHMTERMQQEIAQMKKDPAKKPADNAPASN